MNIEFTLGEIGQIVATLITAKGFACDENSEEMAPVIKMLDSMLGKFLNELSDQEIVALKYVMHQADPNSLSLFPK